MAETVTFNDPDEAALWRAVYVAYVRSSTGMLNPETGKKMGVSEVADQAVHAHRRRQSSFSRGAYREEGRPG